MDPLLTPLAAGGVIPSLRQGDESSYRLSMMPPKMEQLPASSSLGSQQRATG